ncbi:hypothetical protein [Pyxidicoccus xibeiensis]|uniref:hypothetical protein n=1 Tax=Pyxidicoccus xibeiensis TaxID=2906759 RepID=UPI0020A706EC|nr:hypothetical protein [Pyxidicoccus xibeiensis]MCP3140306.1 hypothetical protein [Pyxidicoccus xibeiensis]
MHTLLLLTAVLSSMPPALDAPVTARLEVRSALTLPGSQRGALRLLDTDSDEGEDTPSIVGRVAAEYLAGVGTSFVLTLLNSQLLIDLPGGVLLSVMIASLVLGPAVVVPLTGRALDGRGSVNAALLGSLLGAVGPLLLGVVTSLGCNDPLTLSRVNQCEANIVPVAIFMLLLPSAGAALGYELSAPKPWLSRGHASGTSTPAPRFVPVLAPARYGVGGTVGIVGRL